MTQSQLKARVSHGAGLPPRPSAPPPVAAPSPEEELEHARAVRREAAAAYDQGNDNAAFALAREAFLATLRRSYSPTRAAETGGVPLRFMEARQRTDKVFAQDWEDARRAGTDYALDRFRSQAFDGVPVNVVRNGVVVAQDRKVNPMAMTMFLAALDPERFRRASSSGGTGAPIGRPKRGAVADTADDARTRLADKLGSLEGTKRG